MRNRTMEKRFYYKGKLVRRSRTGEEFKYGILAKRFGKSFFFALTETKEEAEKILDSEIAFEIRNQKGNYDKLARILKGEEPKPYYVIWSEDGMKEVIDRQYKTIEEVRNWQIVELDAPKER